MHRIWSVMATPPMKVRGGFHKKSKVLAMQFLNDPFKDILGARGKPIVFLNGFSSDNQNIKDR